MQSSYSDEEAQTYIDRFGGLPGSNADVALRVYTSRLIGRDPSLVLHGGGNTSVKTTLDDDTGARVEVLCVKGSGWDLGDIEPAGLPAVRLDGLRALRSRVALDDEAMVNAQRTRLLDASAPNPSVETLLHAFLAPKFIDHSHADAILALVDQPEAEAIAAEVFGDALAVVPYVMPGFALAKLAAEVAESHPHARGLLLLRHGLFTWGESARASYEAHVEMVDRAERFIAARRGRVSAALRSSTGRVSSTGRATSPVSGEPVARTASTASSLAGVSGAPVTTGTSASVATVSWARLAPVLRGALSSDTRPVVLHRRQSDAIDAYLAREDLADVSQRGVPTPDHVIRTKRVPLLLAPTPAMDDDALRAHVAERLAAYREAYVGYVAREAAAKGREVRPLDPDPRVVLVPGVGVVTAGASPKEAAIAADLHEHLVDIIEMAEAVGRYEVLPLGDVFDMEYWSLEQAKLGKKASRPLEGRVVIITGAASGIGAACARRFAKEGAQLVLVDRDAGALAPVASALGARYAEVDVTDAEALRGAVTLAVEAFGGLDGVVSNAGVAPQGRMHEVDDETLRRSFEVNFFAHQNLAAVATQVMRAQGRGGFLLFNASKAAFDPGPGFGPYASAKAALIALMKLYAVEQGEAGIRSNAVNADRVRTALLPPDFVAARAAARGLDADAYFRSNLLRREVGVDDVAEAFFFLACAKSTTGCTVTVDGGNPAASPR